jgi:dTDP-4-dehydrorhamnose reductase
VRVYVTGWDGLLGSALVPALRAGGHEVAGMSIADADITDAAFLRDRLGAFRPDTVIHLAALTAVDRCESEPEEAFRVNEVGSRVVAEEANRVNAAVFALSTDYVFDGAKGSPYTEDDATAPLSVYGRSKLAGEDAVRAGASRWTIVRSAWLYGAAGRNFVDTILDVAARQETLAVVDDQTGSPTYVADLAGGLASLVGARAQGLLHLANAGSATWFDLAREALRLTGGDPAKVRRATTAELGRPAPRPPHSALDCARAQARHGVTLRPWRDALADYLGGRAIAAAPVTDKEAS